MFLNRSSGPISLLGGGEIEWKKSRNFPLQIACRHNSYMCSATITLHFWAWCGMKINDKKKPPPPSVLLTPPPPKKTNKKQQQKNNNKKQKNKKEKKRSVRNLRCFLSANGILHHLTGPYICQVTNTHSQEKLKANRLIFVRLQFFELGRKSKQLNTIKLYNYKL